MTGNPLWPHLATIVKIVDETPDVKTFRVVLDDPGARENFRHRPGQVALLSVFGQGEATISISSSPARRDYLEFSVRRVGRLTGVLHQFEEGYRIGVRGPYGNGFPLEELRGRDLLFVGGGIGLAPLRSLINYVLDHRDDFGGVEIVYGARSVADLCFKEELFKVWPKAPGVRVYTTIDRPEYGWDGHVGFVPAYLAELAPTGAGKYALICGPPVMIRLALQELARLGFPPERIVTTLELKMKCGIGKCGRCNIGSTMVCTEGPVFNLARLQALPPEY
ncbi:MAG: FAD/NAD(P)-binding protein [Desulfotomaculales bacterium]